MEKQELPEQWGGSNCKILLAFEAFEAEYLSTYTGPL